MGVPRGDTGECRGRRPIRCGAAPASSRDGRHRVRLLLRQLPQPAADHQRHHGHPPGCARRPGLRLRDGAVVPTTSQGVPPGVSAVVDANGGASCANRNAVSIFANTANWYTAYPEDIKLYGLSWNAQLGTSGIAFQGEVSYRQDNPLQVDDVELLFAALSALSQRYADASQLDQRDATRFRRNRSGLSASRHRAAAVHPDQDRLPIPRRRPGGDPRRVRFQQGLRHAVEGRAALRGARHLHQRQPGNVPAHRLPSRHRIGSGRSTSPTTFRGATVWSAV